MSVLAAPQVQDAILVGRDQLARRSVLAAVKRQRVLILAFTAGFPLVFYALLMALLVMRFGHLPNYVTSYDWLVNVSRIIAGTGSISDMLRIGMDEWLLEIGFMNYSYGLGVSEWSLLIIPHKLAIMMGIGALIGFNFALMADQRPAISRLRQYLRSARCGLMTSVGALCASLTGITLYWVICHSGPTWVVSLAILGIDLSTSRTLEPIGPMISFAGVATLVVSALLIIRDTRADASLQAARPTNEATPC